MTPVDLTPYWPAAERWTGFLPVILPAGALPVAGEELRRQVRARIETDAVLYDLVTVAAAPPFEPTPDWERRFLAGLIESAMPGRHFFAPQGAITIIVVADQQATLDEAVEAVKAMPVWPALHVGLSGIVARRAEGGGITKESVSRIARIVTRVVEQYEEHPDIALDERTFLGRLGAVIEEYRLSLPALEPDTPTRLLAEPTAEVVRAVPRPSAPSALESRPPAPPRHAVEPRRPQPVEKVQRQRPRVEPVLYDGAEIVTVDQRTPMQRLTGQKVTDAETLDALREDGRAIGLVYLVFVPDDGPVDRTAAKRRSTIALELDQALATVGLDALTGRPAHVAVEVFAATSPVEKRGVLRRAGELAESHVPRIGIEYFSISETVRPLLEAYGRTSRALHARGIEVASLHLVFLAAMRFPADDGAVEDWVALLEEARVTWVDFSPPDRRQPLPRMPASPFGLHVLSDKEDVVAVIKRQSEVLYRYVAPRPPAPPATAEPAAAPANGEPDKARRWWQLGRRPAE